MLSCYMMQGQYDRVHVGAACPPGRLAALTALLGPKARSCSCHDRACHDTLGCLEAATCHADAGVRLGLIKTCCFFESERQDSLTALHR